MNFLSLLVVGLILLALPKHNTLGFVYQKISCGRPRLASRSSIKIHLIPDPITSLRTEWVSAALCTNQIPRSADVCLQIGSVDGRIVTFVPRTIREIRTSSVEPDGKITTSAKRRLKESQERRKASKVTIVDQRADELGETADESIDVVVSLQAALKMHTHGLDWKESIRAAARVLKPGGRFLFVENSEIDGERYLDVVLGLTNSTEDTGDDDESPLPIFEVGFDDVDLVLTPHVAGVAIKSQQAGLTSAERAKRRAAEESERLADLSIQAYERGIKKRRRTKKTEMKRSVKKD